MHVINNRIRYKDSFPAEQMQSERKINILKICKIFFIKKTDLVQHFSTIERCSSAGAEYLLLDITLARNLLFSSSIVCIPVLVYYDACRINYITLMITHHLGAATSNFLVFFNDFHKIFDPFFICFGIIINSSYEF